MDRTPRDVPQLGQALVEFALITPVLMFLLMGFVEMALLASAKGAQTFETEELARWAVVHPEDPSPAVLDGLGLHGCDVTLDRGELVRAGSRCQYVPLLLHGLWDGLPVSAEAAAAGQGGDGGASGSGP